MSILPSASNEVIKCAKYVYLWRCIIESIIIWRVMFRVLLTSFFKVWVSRADHLQYVYINLLKIWRRNVMNDRRWMDGWPLVYDAVTQKSIRTEEEEEENVSLCFPSFLSLSVRGKKEKRKAKVILSTWNKSTWFLFAFFLSLLLSLSSSRY